MAKDIKVSEYDTYWEMYERSLINSSEPKNSIKQRRSSVKKFLNYMKSFDNNPKFDDIKRVNVEQFLLDCEIKYKANTVNRYFSFLKDFFGYYREKGVNKNVSFEGWNYRMRDNSRPQIFSDIQISEISNVIEKMGSSLTEYRTKIAFLLLTYTGCTKSELCSMNIYDSEDLVNENVLNYVLLDKQEICFGKSNKYGNKTRTFPINDQVTDRLRQYYEHLKSSLEVDMIKYPFLFHSNYNMDVGEYKRLDPSGINELLKDLVSECASIDSSGIAFQVFRNTFISNMVTKDVPLQIIKELTGAETSSMKIFMDMDKYQIEVKKKILEDNHPFSIVYRT